jgi:hypothetical protein
MATWDGWVGDATPDLVQRRVGKPRVCPAVPMLVEPLDGGAQVVAAAALPGHQSTKSLLGQGHKDRVGCRLVHGDRQVDVATAVAAVLGSGPKRQRRQDQGADLVGVGGLLGGGEQQFLGEPGVEPTARWGPCCSVQPIGSSASQPRWAWAAISG